VALRGFHETTVLHLAVWSGYVDLTAALWTAQPSTAQQAMVNTADALGTTALHWAAFRGHDSLVRLLCVHHADVNAVSATLQTPLHLAWSVLLMALAVDKQNKYKNNNK